MGKQVHYGCQIWCAERPWISPPIIRLHFLFPVHWPIYHTRQYIQPVPFGLSISNCIPKYECKIGKVIKSDHQKISKKNPDMFCISLYQHSVKIMTVLRNKDWTQTVQISAFKSHGSHFLTRIINLPKFYNNIMKSCENI